MTDCSNAAMRDLLPQLAADRLPGAERVAVEAHVASCPTCRAELALVQEMRRAFARTPALDVSAIAAGVSRATAGAATRTTPVRLVAEELPAVAARRPRFRMAWGIAAAALLAVGLGNALSLLREQPVREVAAVPQPRLVTDSIQAPAAASTVAGAAPSAPAPAADSTGLALGATLAMATDAELEALLLELDAVEALPGADPEPVVEVSLPGGRS